MVKGSPTRQSDPHLQRDAWHGTALLLGVQGCAASLVPGRHLHHSVSFNSEPSSRNGLIPSRCNAQWTGTRSGAVKSPASETTWECSCCTEPPLCRGPGLAVAPALPALLYAAMALPVAAAAPVASDGGPSSAGESPPECCRDGEPKPCWCAMASADPSAGTTATPACSQSVDAFEICKAAYRRITVFLRSGLLGKLVGVQDCALHCVRGQGLGMRIAGGASSPKL